MKFNDELTSLRPPSSFRVSFNEMNLPDSPGCFFRVKQRELLDRYCTARICLDYTGSEDWTYWFNNRREEGKDAYDYFRLFHKSMLFESALMFYNIVVDLSWMLCYASLEYCVYDVSGKPLDLSNFISQTDANEALRKFESYISNPNDDSNPLHFLRATDGRYESIINLIFEFWKEFSESDIRKLYNYSKHRGKLLYEEISAINDVTILGLYYGKIPLPSNVKDVSKCVSLEAEIKNLLTFDNDKLFPYVCSLVKQLEAIVEPSPLITA